MEYIKKVSKQAKKFIDKQDKKQRDRIYKAIDNLPKGDVKKLQAHSEFYLIGNYNKML